MTSILATLPLYLFASAPSWIGLISVPAWSPPQHSIAHHLSLSATTVVCGKLLSASILPLELWYYSHTNVFSLSGNGNTIYVITVFYTHLSFISFSSFLHYLFPSPPLCVSVLHIAHGDPETAGRGSVLYPSNKQYSYNQIVAPTSPVLPLSTCPSVGYYHPLSDM